MLYGNEAGCDGGGCNGVNGIFNTSLTPIVSQPKWPKQLNFWTHQLQRASEARSRSYWFVENSVGGRSSDSNSSFCSSFTNYHPLESLKCTIMPERSAVKKRMVCYQQGYPVQLGTNVASPADKDCVINCAKQIQLTNM